MGGQVWPRASPAWLMRVASASSKQLRDVRMVDLIWMAAREGGQSKFSRAGTVWSRTNIARAWVSTREEGLPLMEKRERSVLVGGGRHEESADSPPERRRDARERRAREARPPPPPDEDADHRAPRAQGADAGVLTEGQVLDL